MEDFNYGVLLGVDTLTDYGIDLIMSKGRACAEDFSYSVEYTDSKFRSVLVHLKEDITIGGHWADLTRPGPRHKSNGNKAPTQVSSAFYDVPVPETAGSQTLVQELSFLVDVMANDPLGHQRDPLIASKALVFNLEGKEIPRQRSIMEDELWKRIRASTAHSHGELPDPEAEDEIPPFAPILSGLPDKTTKPEEISEEDIKMGGYLSPKQKDKLFGIVLDFLDVFCKGAQLGKVEGFKATVITDSPLPVPQHARPTGPAKRDIIDKTID
ncbi:hypothetical protein BGX38DRAFT_1145983 [Terfezia claveryi]|nr:hypothetical protein BGX38DRAFT_1145983 [Terfezia claveryi]